MIKPLMWAALLGGVTLWPAPMMQSPSYPAQVAPVPPVLAAPAYTADTPPPYVDTPENLIEFADPAAIAHFARRWGETDRQVVIAHFGDSHVQKGTVTEATRLALEAVRGYGGRGMVFPYAIAKTYSQNDLTSTFSGTWRTGNSIQQPPRLPVGIAGFAAETSDPDASVTLSFTRPLDPGAKRVRVFYAVQGGDYTLTLGSAGDTATADTTSSPGIANLELDSLADAMALRIHADRPGGSFTLLGISIENRPAQGVLYDNLGVGGAVYKALLQQTWFEPEIKAIKPDMVILDWGTNDLIYTKAPEGDFEQVVRSTIDRVRSAVPDADILLTSPQDITFHGRHLQGAALSAALRRIAFDDRCLYWDWYRVAGGADSAGRWRADTLLGSDGVHLTSRGYRVKGGMLAAALIRSVGHARNHSDTPVTGTVPGHP